MKYCENCGKEINDNAVVCPGCGVSTIAQQTAVPVTQNEKPTTAIMALGFAFLIPILGIIFGIVGISKYNDPKLKKQCIIAIPIAIVVIIVGAYYLYASGGAY